MMVSHPPSNSSSKLKPDSRFENMTPSIAPEGSSGVKDGDAALAILGNGSPRRKITPQEDAAVLRKIDVWVMPVVLLVYFLQQLDKCAHVVTSARYFDPPFILDPPCLIHQFMGLCKKQVCKFLKEERRLHFCFIS